MGATVRVVILLIIELLLLSTAVRFMSSDKDLFKIYLMVNDFYDNMSWKIVSEIIDFKNK